MVKKKQEIQEDTKVSAEIDVIAEKKENIAEHTKKLARQFTKIPAKNKKIVEKLIQNAAFMEVTLQELQEAINHDGTQVEYQNGENQWGTKTNPDVQTYNSMIKNYSSVIKQLSDLLPKPDLKNLTTKDDELEKFINAKQI